MLGGCKSIGWPHNYFGADLVNEYFVYFYLHVHSWQHVRVTSNTVISRYPDVQIPDIECLLIKAGHLDIESPVIKCLDIEL